jgi:hypothetical protein
MIGQARKWAEFVMSPKRKRGPTELERSESPGPDVIVDFLFDEGLFFISVSNISDKPAYKVSVTFDRKIWRLDGKNVATLPLFRNIEFLAPHKEIVMFLDSSGSYFSKNRPTRVSARISYQDAQGTKRIATIKHDLEIYRALGFIRRPGEGD